MPLPPILAAKAATTLPSASGLKNDIYVRKWTSTVGKGKKKKVVEHELHLNPLVIVGAAVGAGVAATGAAVTLWAMQRKVEKTMGKKMTRIVRFYGKTVTVIDQPAYSQQETTYIHGYPKIVTVNYPALTHEELGPGGRIIVYSARMRPVRTITSTTAFDYTDAYTLAISDKERAQGWVRDANISEAPDVWGTDSVGGYYQKSASYTNPRKSSYSTGDREGFKIHIG